MLTGGGGLVTACRLLMAGVAGVLPASRLTDVANVLAEMLKTWGQQVHLLLLLRFTPNPTEP